MSGVEEFVEGDEIVAAGAEAAGSEADGEGVAVGAALLCEEPGVARGALVDRPCWLCRQGGRPLSIHDRRVIAQAGRSRFAEANKPAQTYLGRGREQDPRHPIQARRVRRSGTCPGKLTLQLATEVPESAIDQVL